MHRLRALPFFWLTLSLCSELTRAFRSFKPWNPEVHPVGSRGGGGIDFGDDPSGEPSPLGRIASRLLGHRWRAVLAALTIVVLAGLFFKSMHSAGWGVGRDEALLDWKPTNATAAAIPEASEALLLAEQPHLAFKDEGVAKGLSAQEEIAEREVQIADEIKQLQKDEEKVRYRSCFRESHPLAAAIQRAYPFVCACLTVDSFHARHICAGDCGRSGEGERHACRRGVGAVCGGWRRTRSCGGRSAPGAENTCGAEGSQGTESAESGCRGGCEGAHSCGGCWGSS